MPHHHDLLQQYVEHIQAITAKRTGQSETALQSDLDHLLAELLADFGITYNPAINEDLRKLGFSTSSQTNAARPDSLFGHVVLDYKPVGWLSVDRQLNGAEGRLKVERYLDLVTRGGPTHNYEESKKWAGVLWDGGTLTFCHAVCDGWRWSRLLSITPGSLLSLVHIYRSLTRRPLTAATLTAVFARDLSPSSVSSVTITTLLQSLLSPTRTAHTTMLLREWKRLFEQVSTFQLSQLPSLQGWASRHGIHTTDTSLILFALQTYYSLIVKLITSELLTASHFGMSSLAHDIASASTDMDTFVLVKQLEDNVHYRNLRVNNFLEGDFFSWYVSEQSTALAGAIRLVAQEILQFEPATSQLMPHEIKDLLKLFYTSVVDQEIRHDLGEYYTPDWLAEYLLDAAGYTAGPEILDKVVVDPTCGSGTFLVQCISRLREACEREAMPPLDILRKIAHNIRGIDLNPLAVISARANYILAISDLIADLGDEVEIPVYLRVGHKSPPIKSEPIRVKLRFLSDNLTEKAQHNGSAGSSLDPIVGID